MGKARGPEPAGPQRQRRTGAKRFFEDVSDREEPACGRGKKPLRDGFGREELPIGRAKEPGNGAGDG